ncbi:MAG: protein phosphatase 2C domain-containing protein [Bacteroidia bacterium]|nr:protein phosphatase 2C domain-containing protein [Bacteroidia bacterium]
MWLVARASVPGKLHEGSESPSLCQDANLVQKVGESNWLICIVSDGAGSCEYSHVGSGMVVEYTFQRFQSLLETNNWIEENTIPEVEEWHEKAKQTFKEVLTDLQQFARESCYHLSSLSATVIVVIASPLGLLVSHIGDGRAGYRTVQGEWKSMMNPHKGDYANETVFITSPIWDDNLIDTYVESQVIKESEDSFDAFVLLTDGCEDICYETTVLNQETKLYEPVNKPFGGFLNPIIQTIQNLYNQGMTEDEVNLLWESYLTDGTTKLADLQDDKTIVIVAKQPNQC